MANTMDDKTRQNANTSALLDTFMYLSDDYKGRCEGMTLSQVIQDIKSDPKQYGNLMKKPEFQILESAVKNDDVGNLKITKPSWEMNGYNSGTRASTFQDDKGNVFIAYRGTGDGEWLDNGKGMSNAETLQQEEALRYFNTVMEQKNFGADKNIIVTGHSKGGNKAQYVTLASQYGAFIDNTYSFDGQGFSPEAIAALKAKYGESAFNSQLDKMYSINGENDYVNVLGVRVVRDDHLFYVDTPVSETNFGGLHEIPNLFLTFDENGNPIYKPILNKEVDQSFVGQFGDRLAREMMKLPKDQRNDISMTIMKILEMTRGDKYSSGINGEDWNIENITGFIKDGIPEIMYVLVMTPEGRQLLLNYGSQLMSALYDKLGFWGFTAVSIGIIFTVVAFSPIILGAAAIVAGVMATVYILASIVNTIIDYARAIKEFAQDAYNFIVSCGEWANEMLGKLGNWYDRHFNSGYKYAMAHPYIRMNTYNLHDYANRLEGIVRKIHNLDFRLCSVVKEMYDDADFMNVLSMLNMAREGILSCQTGRLQRCINYLKDTASDFERVESRIVSKLGELG